MKQRRKGWPAGSMGKWMQYFYIAHNTSFYPHIFAQALSSKGTDRVGGGGGQVYYWAPLAAWSVFVPA